MKLRLTTLICAAVFGTCALATSFVVPTDDEMIEKSAMIVIGTIEGSYVEDNDGTIETIDQLRIERVLKDTLRRSELIEIASPGGLTGDRGVIVSAAPRFHQGDRVLLFLTRHGRRWTTTDLTLGKFRFTTSTTGEKLLVRDMEDVVGWDHYGQVHREKVRREEGFLRFIEERMHGRAVKADYEVDASEVTLAPEPESGPSVQVNAAPFPGATYTSWVNSQPTRWPNISAGVTFRKRADQNAAGLSDGGVSVIQNSLAAWTNECGSVINLNYGGTTTTASANFDGVNVVEFNDPQGRVSGSWSGSGTIAITFNSFTSDHPFAGLTWWSIGSADVVFQDGFPGTHSAFATAMTHELGHAIGWRHSNQNHQTGGACNSSVEECTSAAVMNSTVVTRYNYTLQPWDINAAQSVYPGGTCGPSCTPPSITTQPASSTISGGSVTLQVVATGTTPLSYQWYIGASGNTANPISGATGSSVMVTPASTTSYWVRVFNSCGSVNSATATITVTSNPPPSGAIRSRTDFDGDARADIFWRHTGDGRNQIWYMSGATPTAIAKASLSLDWTPVAFGDFNGDTRSDILWRHTSGATRVWLLTSRGTTTVQVSTSIALAWEMQGSGDFNADGRADLLWRNQSTGQNVVWLMNGNTPSVVQFGVTPTSHRLAATGDFDGDGRFDFLFRTNTGTNYIWFWKTTGVVQQSVNSLATAWIAQGTGDFNGDGRSDVLWRAPSTGSNLLWLMNGSTVTARTIAAVPSGWRVGTIGDVDADGDHDIVWQGDNNYHFIMLMSGGNIASQPALPSFADLAWRMIHLP